MVLHIQCNEPTCFKENIEHSKWELYLDTKMDALVQNDAWILVSLLDGKKAENRENLELGERRQRRVEPRTGGNAWVACWWKTWDQSKEGIV